jgi:hypothetical protein
MEGKASKLAGKGSEIAMVGAIFQGFPVKGRWEDIRDCCFYVKEAVTNIVYHRPLDELPLVLQKLLQPNKGTLWETESVRNALYA